MTTNQIILFIVLGILIVGFVVLAIISTTMVITYVKNMTDAVNSSLYNKFHCGDIFCYAKPKDLNLPENIPTKYDPVFARYCADLVVRIETHLYDKTNKVVIPNGMKMIKEIYESNSELMFGMVLLDENNNIWISYRGTANIDEWEDDFTYNQTGLPGKKTLYQVDAAFLRSPKSLTDTPDPRVHEGFVKIYKEFRQDLLDLLSKTSHKNIIVTGHSLGAAMTAITAVDLKNQGYSPIAYKFASPRVGDKAFADLVGKIPLFHIYNTSDIIPTLPFAVSPNLSHTDKPYFYQHCGVSYPFTNNWLSAINNHIMSVHIHYLDSMIS